MAPCGWIGLSPTLPPSSPAAQRWGVLLSSLHAYLNKPSALPFCTPGLNGCMASAQRVSLWLALRIVCIYLRAQWSVTILNGLTTRSLREQPRSPSYGCPPGVTACVKKNATGLSMLSLSSWLNTLNNMLRGIHLYNELLIFMYKPTGQHLGEVLL